MRTELRLPEFPSLPQACVQTFAAAEANADVPVRHRNTWVSADKLLQTRQLKVLAYPSSIYHTVPQPGAENVVMVEYTITRPNVLISLMF